MNYYYTNWLTDPGHSGSKPIKLENGKWYHVSVEYGDNERDKKIKQMLRFNKIYDLIKANPSKAILYLKDEDDSVKHVAGLVVKGKWNW